MYQNCMMPNDSPFDKRWLTSQEKINKAPFPYEIQMDTISYMSCSSTPAPVNPQMFYTFRLGALSSTSGIRLSKAFRDYALKQNMSLEDRLNLIAKNSKLVRYQVADENSDEEETVEKSIQMQFSLRRNKSRSAVMWTHIEEDRQIHNLWNPIYFNDGELARIINELPDGTFLNNYAKATGGGNQLMASIFFGTVPHEVLQGVFKEKENPDPASLIVGYLSPKDFGSPYDNRTQLLRPTKTDGSESLHHVYGTNYVPSFSVPKNDIGEFGYLDEDEDNVKVLLAVNEYNPQSNRLLQSHVCGEDSIQLMVVFGEPSTYAAANCGRFDEPPIDQEKYELANDVLNYYEDYWQISKNVNCIRASGVGGGGTNEGRRCYGNVPDSRIDEIQWVIGRDPAVHKCGRPDSDVKPCPHFVSICTLETRP